MDYCKFLRHVMMEMPIVKMAAHLLAEWNNIIHASTITLFSMFLYAIIPEKSNSLPLSSIKSQAKIQYKYK